MSAVEIASAYLAVYAKMPGVENDIRKALGGKDVETAIDAEGTKAGGSWSKGLVKGLVAGAAGAAVVGFTKSVVQSFGELEQNLGGSEAVFGDYAQNVQKMGESAYKNLGISQSEYLANANKMGALFQGSGMEQKKSLDLTTKAMQRAADMASVMGIEQSVALESVTGAAKGNFTMMDNIGVAMNATTIEAYAAAKGMEGWSFATATSAEKADLAMQMFLENTSQYAGNFAREATETVTGSFGLMSASWSELIAGLGNEDADMGQLTSNLVEAFVAVVRNVAPVIGELFQSLPEVFATLGAEIGPAFAAMFDGMFEGSPLAGMLDGLDLGVFLELASALSPVMLMLQALQPLLPEIANLFMQVAGAVLPLAQELAAALVPIITQLMAAMLPIVEQIVPILAQLFQQLTPIVLMLVEAFMPLLEPILALIEPLLNLVMMILPPLVELLGMLIPVVTGIVEAIVTFLIPVFTAVADAIGGILEPAIQMISDVLVGLNDFIMGVFTGNWERAWEGVAGVFSGIWNGIKETLRGIINGIIGIINGAIEGINGVAGGVSDLTGGAIDFTIPSIPQLAEGGVVKARPGGIPAVIGEGRYDEAVLPLSPEVLTALGGGGDSGPRGPLVEVHAAPGMDEVEIAHIAAREAEWARERGV